MKGAAVPEVLVRSDLLSVPEAAAYINRSVNFVRRRVRYETPIVQHGDRAPLFFRRSDLDMWIARNTHVPAR